MKKQEKYNWIFHETQRPSLASERTNAAFPPKKGSKGNYDEDKLANARKKWGKCQGSNKNKFMVCLENATIKVEVIK